LKSPLKTHQQAVEHCEATIVEEVMELSELAARLVFGLSRNWLGKTPSTPRP
jgi:hypothetical protein